MALPFGQIGFLICALGCALLASYDFASQILAHNLALSDFTVFWTATRFEHVYDTIEFTRAQIGLVPSSQALRPFPYPPPALLIIAPLRWLSFESAALLWTAAGVSAFLFACRLYGRGGLLAILAPMVALSVLAGQATLFLGAALAAGVALLDRRPILAGVLFGVVGAIKPTMAALVPLALIVTSNRRTLIPTFAAGGILVLASLMLGPSKWVEWFHSLPAFLAQVQGPGFRQTNVAPGLWFAPLGLATVPFAFLATRRPDIRLIALVSGSACCVPYMMSYDMAAMAPAAASLMLRRDPLGWIVGSLAFVFVFLRLAPEIALGVCILITIQKWISPRLAVHERLLETPARDLRKRPQRNDELRRGR